VSIIRIGSKRGRKIKREILRNKWKLKDKKVWIGENLTGEKKRIR